MNAADEATVDIIADMTHDIRGAAASAVVEPRQQRLGLLRALSQFALPDADGNAVTAKDISAKATD